jgi:hypothetical protein
MHAATLQGVSTQALVPIVAAGKHRGQVRETFGGKRGGAGADVCIRLPVHARVVIQSIQNIQEYY